MKLNDRTRRILYMFPFAVIGLCLALYFRHWVPKHIVKTDHFKVYSTASVEDTEKTGELAELLYEKYTDVFGFKDKKIDYKMKLRLFKSRKEFRRVNGIYRWAEAMYYARRCNAYFDKTAENPYHWMIHEATHQLNNELAEYDIELWLNEGIACYFSTSKIVENKMHLGIIDEETYPIWWFGSFKLTENLNNDIKNKIIIPLRFIISDKGGPPRNKFFNQYYLHWWSIVHFLMEFEDGKHREGLKKLVLEGGTIEGFEKYIGKISDIEKQWNKHLFAKIKYIENYNGIRRDKKAVRN